MEPFRGFPEGKVHLTPLPAAFFSELLPQIDDLAELKLILYFFWRVDHMEGKFRYLRQRDFSEDERFMQGLGTDPAEAQAALDHALDAAFRRGLLLAASVPANQGNESIYFLNSPKGRAAIEAIQRGRWRPSTEDSVSFEPPQESPNIFRLYEENIGPLTPLIAEALAEAEDTYPHSWILEAFRIAVENNKRSWRYILAILERWYTEGRDERQDQRDSEEARRRYLKWLDPDR